MAIEAIKGAGMTYLGSSASAEVRSDAAIKVEHAEAAVTSIKLANETSAMNTKGTDPDGPVCVISAHMDNSFREGTDTTVRRQNGRLFAPGISDASRALACMLQVIRMVVNNDIKTKGTLLFIATVGQEAEGDLRGVKRIFYSSGIHVDGVLVLDGADPGRSFLR